MHRVTRWVSDRGDVVQVELACLDSFWEPHAAITEPIGPFDDVDQVLADCERTAHALGGWRAHQGVLFSP